MTLEEKRDILAKISAILDEHIENSRNPPENIKNHSEGCEMLTIKECAAQVKGLSEHTIRLLITRGEIASIRTGEGKHGKILVPKTALDDYIRKIGG